MFFIMLSLYHPFVRCFQCKINSTSPCSLRIRMPDNLGPTMAPPAMGYGREVGAVRAVGKGAATTVDLMAGMGLKYVHATGKGRKGQQGDLEKSRAQVRGITRMTPSLTLC